MLEGLVFKAADGRRIRYELTDSLPDSRNGYRSVVAPDGQEIGSSFRDENGNLYLTNGVAMVRVTSGKVPVWYRGELLDHVLCRPAHSSE